MPDQTSANETNEDESTLLVEIVTEQSDWEKGAWDGVQDDIQHAAIAAFHAGIDARTDISFPDVDIEISIRLTDDKEMTTLNAQWRNIDRPTNVLSFPSWDGNTELYNGESGILLGDVVLARQTIEAEADGANLPHVNHVKHLVVHGVLHLLGFDHETDEEAEIMESLEVKVLSNIGVASPYKDRKKENVI
jgi:probable rRNA maturation factor